MLDQSEKRKTFDKLNSQINQTIQKGGAFARPRQMRLAMRSCRDPKWELEWVEALVLFNCKMRAQPAKTHRLLGVIKRRRLRRNQQDVFDAYMKRVTEILHPKVLTPHGYNLTFDSLDSTEILANLGAIAEPIVDMGYPVFLYAGALLGYERSRALIGHDDDIDLGVYLGECATSEVPQRWMAYKKTLIENGMLSEKEVKHNAAMFKITTKLPIEVDLFPAWTDQGRFSVYPYSFAELPSNALLPFKSYGQDPLMLPADTEALLAQSYGENWRIPDPLFHLNWQEKKKIFAELLAQNYAM